MAGSLNKVLLIGRLGADPEVKQMVNGKSVARLSLATSNSWKDKSTNEKIVASREVKSLILELNEIYKENKDPDLMDMMKRLTLIKRKVEKRLKGRPGS